MYKSYLREYSEVVGGWRKPRYLTDRCAPDDLLTSRGKAVEALERFHIEETPVDPLQRIRVRGAMRSAFTRVRFVSNRPPSINRGTCRQSKTYDALRSERYRQACLWMLLFNLEIIDCVGLEFSGDPRNGVGRGSWY